MYCCSGIVVETIFLIFDYFIISTVAVLGAGLMGAGIGHVSYYKFC